MEITAKKGKDNGRINFSTNKKLKNKPFSSIEKNRLKFVCLEENTFCNPTQ